MKENRYEENEKMQEDKSFHEEKKCHDCKNKCCCCCCCCCEEEKKEEQKHVHEILGSVKIVKERKQEKEDHNNCKENNHEKYDCFKKDNHKDEKHEDKNDYKKEKHEDKKEEECHNHRFATVSGEAIYIDCGKDHIHEVEFRTDFFEDHFHTFKGKSGGAIWVGEGRHVHFAEAQTSFNDGHKHEFIVASLIDNPIGHHKA